MPAGSSSPMAGRCGATLRRKPGRFCTAYPLTGKTRCALHGGKSLAGPANGNWKHGMYSTVLPGALGTHYATARQNPALVALTEQIALVDAKVFELFEQVQQGESPAAWTQVLELASAPQTPFVGNWHIDAICAHLEAVTRGELRNLLINIPPGCMDDARSDVERQRVIDHFDETLSSRGKALHAATVIIMQRLHQHDLAAHVLERHRATYTHLCLPMQYEPPQPPTPGAPPVPRMPVTPLGWQDPRTEPGELQQRPVPPGGAQFKRDWFRLVDALPAQGRLKTCRGWDCAATEPKPGTDPDYTVGTKIAHFSDGLYYVEDVIRGRWSPGVVDQTIRQTAELDGPRVRIREEQEGGHSGKNVIASHTRMLAGYDYQGQPATGAKTTRWRPFAVQAEAGNVRLLTGAWNQAWLEELTSVPAAKHDDQADSAALAFEAVALGYRAASVARTREGG